MHRDRRLRLLPAAVLAVSLGGPATRAETAAKADHAAPTAPAGCIAGPALAIPAAPLHIGTQSYPRTLDLCDRHVVLTFDDGPSPKTTPRILQALKEAGVKATFFLIGRNTCRHPELARQELAEGHTVGHHSDTHPAFTLRGFDEASALRDIDEGIATDEAAIYGKAATPDHPHVPFFRFPGFADTPALLADLDRRDIAVFGSDLWAGDWIAMTPDHERERVMALLEARPHHNGIILFHDTKASTAAMLPDLLRELKAKGYEVVHLVAKAGAPVPPLTEPSGREPETERIIDHLVPPIVPGAHHLKPAAAPTCPSAGEDIADHTRP